MTLTKTHYPEFVPNQILTDEQLNQLHVHLDAESRATRVRLVGTGIVCGLDWSFDAGARAITLAGGYGLSSDGYLIEVAETIYARVRPYVDPDVDEQGTSRYWTSPAGEPIKALELVTDSPENQTLPRLAASDLKDRALVLYLEKRPVELRSCLVADCNDKGVDVHLDVRALLIAKSDLEPLPAAAAPPRPVRIARFHTEYRGNGDVDGAWQDIISENVRDDDGPGWLTGAIATAFTDYGGLLGIAAPDLERIRGLTKGTGSWQDRYDAVKDLAAAHYEAVTAAYRHLRGCAGGPEFPRHLALGAGDGTEGHRHELRPAPARDVLDGDLERVKKLFRRIVAMVDALGFETQKEVRLTPSRGEDRALGDRAVPYYYELTPELEETWQARPGPTADPLWSYHRWGGSPDAAVSGAPFVRIEGHVGLYWDAASKAILDQRRGLVDFDLRRIDVEANSGELLCDPEPFTTLWAALRHEIHHLLAQLRGDVPKPANPAPGNRVDQAAVALHGSIDAAEAALPAELGALGYPAFATPYKKVLADLRHYWLAWQAQEIAQGRAQDVADADPIAWPLAALGGGILTRVATLAAAFEELRRTHVGSFDNLLARHDGVDHLSGVAPGDTFFLVCNDERVIADFTLPGRLACCCEVDPASVCLPPMALPEHRIVRLVDDGAGGFQPVSEKIDLLANDFDPNVPRRRDASLKVTAVQTTGLSTGAKVVLEQNRFATYSHTSPAPGIVDRFSYTLVSENPACPGSDQGEVVVLLKPKPPAADGHVTGSVEEEGGTLVPDARVRIEETGQQAQGSSKGFFAFFNLTPGSYTLRAYHEAYLGVPSVAEVKAGQEAIVSLVLRRLGIVEVTARENETNKTIPDAGVLLLERPELSPETAGGKYTFRDLQEGPYTVRATRNGYLVPPNQAVTVVTGQVKAVTFVLTANGKISGTVKNATGANLSGVSVSLAGPVGRGSVNTPTDGSYSFNQLPPGNYTVSTQHSSYYPASVTLTLDAGTQSTRTFNLVVIPGKISGRVTSSTGANVSGASVSASGPTPGSATTDAGGNYTLDNLQPGTYNLTVTHGSHYQQTGSVTVNPNSTATRDFTLTVIPGRISGWVRSTSGANISGATINTTSGPSNRSVTSDANGNYNLDNLQPGTYSVSVSHGSYNSGSGTGIAVSANTATTRNFNLSPKVQTATVTVDVERLYSYYDEPLSEPASGASVSLGGFSGTANSAGQVTFYNVPYGIYTLTATKGKSASQSETVDASSEYFYIVINDTINKPSPNQPYESF